MRCAVVPTAAGGTGAATAGAGAGAGAGDCGGKGRLLQPANRSVKAMKLLAITIDFVALRPEFMPAADSFFLEIVVVLMQYTINLLG